MMAGQVLTRTTAPARLISVADVKTQCRVDGNDEDLYIDRLAKAAESKLDGPSGMVGRALVTQRWTLVRGSMTGRETLSIPLLPFRSVVSIRYYDAANERQTADLSSFVIFGGEDDAYIEPLTTWPVMASRPDALEVVFEAGYGAPDDVPPGLVHAAIMLAAHWYHHREPVAPNGAPAPVPMTIESLVSLEKSGWVRA